MGDTSPGRGAWRIWVPPLFTTLVMMAQISHQDGTLVAPTTWQLIIALHGTMSLFFRLRYPLAVTVVTILAGSLLPLTAGHVVVADAAGIVALYTLATLRPRRIVVAAALGAAAAMTASAVPWQPGSVWALENLLPLNYAVIAAAVGDASRNRRELLAEVRQRAVQAELTREQEARRQVREERVRIARDLHDVVAHHITLVNAQAGVAHHLMRSHPDRAQLALAGIRETSRVALDELRCTVGLLRSDDETPQSRQPTPTLTDLDGLVGSFRASGFDVTVHRDGTPRPLTGSADVSAYRIVQEALTNAGKHGTVRHAEVYLAYDDTRLRIAVVNPARPGHRGAGTGHGLIGMRERAGAVGGTLTARMDGDGRFVVEADLPLERS
ncbi:sensor histidine kinase [Actinoplanes derwentensis]|uniref:histidine kinase n=1 Tax=Actinoplanes derwentensis TaxID=113562 RepID=A0A1H1R9B9_9ACTN|nr:histidine kinase [Actinoplanes derwentensis]GID88032.1 two-component sensor histidine kinase [Actinoplanes derwentensis]SDS31479.1 Signal transduction histidine kinase [Actinoplanes derwentensis]